MDVLDNLLAKAARIPHKQLSLFVFWFLFVIVSLLAAQVTWKLIPANAPLATWQASAIASTTAKSINLQGVHNLHLFGNHDASQVSRAPVVETITDAPKTSLSILLTGVVASTTETQGLAVIDSRGVQDTYSLGDKISGTSASLKEVYADRIIITNAGRYETLMLDGLPYTTNGQVNQQLQQAKQSQDVSRVDQRDRKSVV